MDGGATARGLKLARSRRCGKRSLSLNLFIAIIKLKVNVMIKHSVLIDLHELLFTGLPSFMFG